MAKDEQRGELGGTEDRAFLPDDGDGSSLGGAGLLEIDKTGSMFGADVLSEVLGDEGIQTRRKPRDFTVFRPDAEMISQGWERINDLYVDKYRIVAFVQPKDDPVPKSYIFFGLSLRSFVGDSQSIKDIKCADENKGLYQVLEELRNTHLIKDGRYSAGIARDESPKYPRVGFGFSVTYNPDGDIQAQVDSISSQAYELSQIVRGELNKAITGKEIPKNPKRQDNVVRYISGVRTIEMYKWAYEKKEVISLEEVTAFEPLDEATQPDFASQQVQQISDAYVAETQGKKPKPVPAGGQPRYKRFLARFSRGPSKKKKPRTK